MPYKIPLHCPCCSTPLVRDGAHFFCPNETGCPDQIAQRLQHSVSKGALDWDGFGPAQVDALIGKCGCHQFSDILSLDPVAIAPVLGPGQKSKFLTERERVKTAPLWRKLVALGIEGVGQTACKELCEEYHALEQIVRITVDPEFAGGRVVAVDPVKLESILGPVALKNFLRFIQIHLKELERCELYGYTLSEEAPVTSTGPLSGKTFCITGAMMSGTRPQVSVTIEKYGGKMKGSVGKGLDFLVAGEAGGAGKANAAKKWGTKVIDESALYAMMGIPTPTAAVTEQNEWD
jgi:DNA ligase (NAD+)